MLKGSTEVLAHALGDDTKDHRSSEGTIGICTPERYRDDAKWQISERILSQLEKGSSGEEDTE